MSKKGLQVALAFGKSLPDFANYEEAKDYYFSFRERHLELLRQISQRQATFVMDFSPESLKSLEKLYFALHESNLFEDLKTTREEFESCMSVYYGETVVRNCSKASWVVVPFGFLPNKFELMVRSTNCGEGIGRFPDHYRSPGNKGHDSLWRRFHQRFWSRELRTDPPEAVSASAVWAQYDPAQAEALGHYSLFEGPRELAGKDRYDWSKEEARLYLQWLESSLEGRVRGLLNYFGESNDGPPERTLSRVGQRVAQVVRAPRFVTINGPDNFSESYQLTEEGLSLAIDLNLLIAKFLLDEFSPAVHWKMPKKSRNVADYHMPVLSGFFGPEFQALDAINSWVFSVLAGRKSPVIWLETYERLKSTAPKGPSL